MRCALLLVLLLVGVIKAARTHEELAAELRADPIIAEVAAPDYAACAVHRSARGSRALDVYLASLLQHGRIWFAPAQSARAFATLEDALKGCGARDNATAVAIILLERLVAITPATFTNVPERIQSVYVRGVSLSVKDAGDSARPLIFGSLGGAHRPYRLAFEAVTFAFGEADCGVGSAVRFEAHDCLFMRAGSRACTAVPPFGELARGESHFSDCEFINIAPPAANVTYSM